jgi:hypothetical protein
MSRRAAAVRAASRGALGLLAALLLSSSARAQQGFLLPLEAGAPLALGVAWDRDDGRPLGEAGSCMAGTGVERHGGGPTTWTLVVLSRAGGRLLVGAHVARVVASEALADARIPDAARRLAARDEEEFRLLCGDGFVASRALGGQYAGEIEIGPSEARAASARLRTGVWTEPGPFAAALGPLLEVRGVQVRELPDGRRAGAPAIAPARFLERALAFAETVTEENARPYLAMVRPYPKAAFAGTVVAVDPTLGWGDAARAVFLHEAGGGMGGSAAARAAEMRKAVVKRRAGDPRRPFDAPSEWAALPIPPPAPAPMSAPDASDDTRAPAEPAPAAIETEPTPPAPGVEPVPAAIDSTAAPAASVSRRRVAALVYAAAAGKTPVFATTEPPPGVHAERVQQRSYWIPGVAERTPAVHEALARAAASAPERGTTVVVAEVGGIAVVLTDVAPAAGIHATAAGGLWAWIAGVSAPTPAQQEALAAVARGAD